jgi:ribonuclease P protein component
MKGEEHLTKPRQYALVYARGSSSVTSLVVLRYLTNGLALSRYGLSVSKRVGKAVIRNKMKRRLRAILRSMPLKPGWDIVFIVRPAAANADYAALQRTITGSLARTKLLRPSQKDSI